MNSQWKMFLQCVLLAIAIAIMWYSLAQRQKGHTYKKTGKVLRLTDESSNTRNAITYK
jgi:hypothetical protein